jgi:ribosomal protein L29
MTLPKYKELEPLKTKEEIEKEIFLAQKSLFDLRMKKAANQSIKSHLFIHSKRRIAQLKFKQNSLIN